MSRLVRARLKALAFFALGAAFLGYLAFHSFDHGRPVLGAVAAAGAALNAYVVASAWIAWQRGELPGFDSPEDLREYRRRRSE